MVGATHVLFMGGGDVLFATSSARALLSDLVAVQPLGTHWRYSLTAEAAHHTVVHLPCRYNCVSAHETTFFRDFTLYPSDLLGKYAQNMSGHEMFCPKLGVIPLQCRKPCASIKSQPSDRDR